MSALVFDFVSDDALRANLAADAAELDTAVKHKANKAAVVLSGSIIEAVLVDHLLTTGYEDRAKVNVLNLGLMKLIEAARHEGVLSEKTESLAQAIRGFRNLIHPGRLLRLQETVSDELGVVCQALVKMVCDEMTDRASRSFGSTTEQLIAKLRKDPSSSRMIAQLTKSLHPGHAKRFLFGKAQSAFTESMFERSSDDFRSALKVAHAFLFERADPPVKAEYLDRLAALVLSADEYDIDLNLSHFFEGSYLQHGSPEKTKILIERIIVGLTGNQKWAATTALEGIFMSYEMAQIALQGIAKDLDQMSSATREQVGHTLSLNLAFNLSEKGERCLHAFIEKLAPMPHDKCRGSSMKWLRRLIGDGPRFNPPPNLDDDVPF